MQFYPALGINVLAIDTDLSFSRDPYPYLKGELMGGESLTFQRECGAFPCVNVGFMYMQNAAPGGGAEFVFKRFWEKYLEILGTEYKHGNGEICTMCMWEQDMISDVIWEAVHGAEQWGLTLKPLHTGPEEAPWLRENIEQCGAPCQINFAETPLAPLGQVHFLSSVNSSLCLKGGSHEDWVKTRHGCSYGITKAATIWPEGSRPEVIAQAPYWMATTVEMWIGMSRRPLPVIAMHFMSAKRAGMVIHGAWNIRSDVLAGNLEPLPEERRPDGDSRLRLLALRDPVS